MLLQAIEKRALAITLGHPSRIREDGTFSLVGIGGANTAGADVTERTALTVPAIYCAVKIIAETAAMLPLSVYQRDGKQRRELPDHATSIVLDESPNTEQTGYEFREMMTAWAALRGVAYAEIVRDNGGRVVALWPIPPDWVNTIRDENGELAYRIYTPTSLYQTESGYKILAAENVLRLSGFTYGSLRGVDLVTYFAQTMGLAMATEKYGAQFFANGSVPGGMLKYPGTLTEDARINIKRSWEERHKGLDMAHRIAVLEGGMEWAAMGVTNEHAQFIETRQFQIEEFARLLRLSPTKLMDFRRATFSNIEYLGIEFVTDTMMPWLTRHEKRFNLSLLTPAERRQGMYTRHVVQALLRGDNASRSNLYHQMVLDGIYSPNEVRALEDVDPQPDGLGDVYYRPVNVTTVGAGALPPSDAERMDDAFDIVFHSALREIVSRERADVMRATEGHLAKGDIDAARTAIESFYGGHVDYVTRKIKPVVTGYLRAFNSNSSADEVSERMAKRICAANHTAAVTGAVNTESLRATFDMSQSRWGGAALVDYV